MPKQRSTEPSNLMPLRIGIVLAAVCGLGFVVWNDTQKQKPAKADQFPGGSINPGGNGGGFLGGGGGLPGGLGGNQPNDPPQNSPLTLGAPVKPPVAVQERIPAPGSGQRRFGRLRATIGSSSYQHVALSPDGLQAAAVIPSEQALDLYELKTGKKVSTVSPNAGLINDAIFSPDGKTLAIAGHFGPRFYEVTTGQVRGTELKFYADTMAYSPDGKYLAVIGHDKLRCIDMSSEAIVAVLEKPRRFGQSALAFSPDGRFLAFDGPEKSIKIFDVTTWNEVATCNGHKEDVSVLAYSPNGSILASVSVNEDQVFLWNPTNGDQIRTIKPDEDFSGSRSLSFTPSGKCLVVGDTETYFLSPQTGSNEGRMELGGTDRAISADGLFMAHVGFGIKGIQLWDLDATRESGTYAVEKAVSKGALSPDGKTGATASEKAIALHAISSGKLTHTLMAAGIVRGLAFSPDGKLLASSCDEQKIEIWNVAEGSKVQTLTSKSFSLSALCFSPSGEQLAVGAGKRIELWDLKTNKPAAMLQGHRGDILWLTYSPDGKALASTSEDSTVRLWDPSSGKLIKGVLAHEGAIHCASFSPDGSKLVTTGTKEDGTIALWESGTGKEIWTKPAHEGAISGAVFSPDGNAILTTSRDNTLRAWKTEDGSRIMEMQLPTGGNQAFAVSPDQKTFLTLTDKTVKLWDATLGSTAPSEGRLDIIRNAAPTSEGTDRQWAVFYSKWMSPPLPIRQEDLPVVSSDKKWLLCRGDASSEDFKDGSHLVIRATSDWKVARIIDTQLDEITTVAISGKGQWLAAAHKSKKISLWNRDTGEKKAELTVAKEPVKHMVFSPDGTILATSTDTRQDPLILWEVATGGKKQSISPGEYESYRSIAFSPDGSQIAVAMDALTDGTKKQVVLISAATGQQVRTFPMGHAIYSVAFSQDGQLLIGAGSSGPEGGQAKVWSLQTGKVVQGVTTPSTIEDAALTPDGKYLLTKMSYGLGTFIWEMSSAKKIGPFNIPQRGRYAFSPDGESIVVADTGEDTIDLVSISDLTNPTLQEVASAILHPAVDGEIFRVDDVIHVNLTADGRKSVAAIQQLPRLTMPFSVNLGDSPLFPPDGLATLGSMKNLRELYIYDSGITNESLKYLQNANDLKVLVLSRNKAVTSEGIRQLAGLSNLEVLELDATGLRPEDLKSLEPFKKLKKLSLVNLAVSDDHLQALQVLKELGTLNLSYSELSGKGLAHLKPLSKLTTLILEGSELTNEGMPSLKMLPQVKVLNLNSTSITGEGLVHLKGLAKLEELYIDELELKDADLAHLKGLPLKKLVLPETIGNEGAAHLAEMKSLTYLDMRDAKVTDDGLKHLAGLTNLETLMLHYTKMTDKGLAHLKGLKNLKTLLVGDSVTSEAKKEMRKLLPGAKISNYE